MPTIADRYRDLPERYPSPRQYFVGQSRYAVELPDNILIFCRRDGSHALQVPIAHHRHVLLLVLAGNGSVIINGERFDLRPAHLLLLLPHQMHLMLFEHPRINWLYVTFEAPENPCWDPIANQPLPFPETAAPYLQDLIQCDIREYGNDPFTGMRAALNILQLLNTVLAEMRRDDAIPRRATAEPTLADRINRYLYRHLDQPLNIHLLAEKFGYSPTHLRRLYQSFMGLPIGSYLRSMRHANAQQLLRRTSLPLAEIARRCGFGSSYAFAAAFRTREGIPPGEFRRRHRLPSS